MVSVTVTQFHKWDNSSPYGKAVMEYTAGARGPPRVLLSLALGQKENWGA
jgi:hypothetical protein